jgi:hypothetical protein
LEAKRFLNTDPDAMRESWEARKQRQWNATYCNHESWREAIDHGWSIISTLAFRRGEQMTSPVCAGSCAACSVPLTCVVRLTVPVVQLITEPSLVQISPAVSVPMPTTVPCEPMLIHELPLQNCITL